jgi:hypothetical protein
MMAQSTRCLLHRHPRTTPQRFDIDTCVMKRQSQTCRLVLYKKRISL